MPTKFSILSKFFLGSIKHCIVYKGVAAKLDWMRVTLPGFKIEFAFHLDRLFVVLSIIGWKVELDTLSLIIE